jgi:carboxymethylenebutenolidase
LWSNGIARILDLEDAMCFDRDARPPLPPVAGAAAEQGDLVLTAADGNRLAAYFAHAADPTGAGIVIMPDVRGLHAFYKELAQRFAEAGVDAVAIDYFGRTAGTGPRGHDFDYPTHVRQTTVEGVTADTGAGVAHLRSPQGGGARAVFTVGFCFGGGRSWRQAAAGHGLAGAIGLYGNPQLTLDALDRVQAPLLVLVAGDDNATPVSVFEDFDRRLTAAGLPHDLHVYEGAPHSFFDRTFQQHADASADAWRRMLDFIARHTPARV